MTAAQLAPPPAPAFAADPYRDHSGLRDASQTCRAIGPAYGQPLWNGRTPDHRQVIMLAPIDGGIITVLDGRDASGGEGQIIHWLNWHIWLQVAHLPWEAAVIIMDRLVIEADHKLEIQGQTVVALSQSHGCAPLPARPSMEQRAAFMSPTAWLAIAGATPETATRWLALAIADIKKGAGSCRT